MALRLPPEHSFAAPLRKGMKDGDATNRLRGGLTKLSPGDGKIGDPMGFVGLGRNESGILLLSSLGVGILCYVCHGSDATTMQIN